MQKFENRTFYFELEDHNISTLKSFVASHKLGKNFPGSFSQKLTQSAKRQTETNFMIERFVDKNL